MRGEREIEIERERLLCCYDVKKGMKWGLREGNEMGVILLLGGKRKQQC